MIYGETEHMEFEFDLQQLTVKELVGPHVKLISM